MTAPLSITRSKSVWETKNPVLQSRQPGFERETGKLKIGDGTTRLNALYGGAGAPVPVYGAHNNPYRHAYADKAIVALRFDDADSVDETVAAYCSARNLPVGLAVHSNAPNGTGKLTTAQLLTNQQRGHEIMAHSKSHGTGPANDAAFLDETVGSAQVLRAADFRIQTFTQPGTWTNNALYGLDKDTLYETAHGRAFLANFLGAQGYRIDDYGAQNNNTRPLPLLNKYGARPTSADGLSLATLQDKVERAISSKGSIEIFWHLRNADLDNIVYPFILWLRDQRTAGRLDVVTPGYALNAQPGTPINLCPEGDFVAMQAWRTANAAAVTAGTNGGTNWSVTLPSSNYLVAGRSAGKYAMRTTSGNQVRWKVNSINNLRSLLIEGWVKSQDGTGASSPRGLVTVLSGGVTDKAQTFPDGASGASTTDATWRKVQWLVGVPTGGVSLEIVLYAFSGTPVWTDLSIRPV